MALIKISDSKTSLPPIIKITMGTKSTMFKVKSLVVTQNPNSSSCK